jgi:hypothetical protein
MGRFIIKDFKFLIHPVFEFGYFYCRAIQINDPFT